MGAGIAETNGSQVADARRTGPLMGPATNEHSATMCSSLTMLEKQGSATSKTDVYEPRKAADLAEAVRIIRG